MCGDLYDWTWNNSDEMERVLKQMRRDIERAKKRLKNRPLCENWGQDEYRKLEDKYGIYTYKYKEARLMLSRFDDWLMNYDGLD